MRPMVVVMTDVLGEDGLEVTAAEGSASGRGTHDGGFR